MRKTTEVLIPATDPGRDKGKRFLITEKSAADAEQWAIRALGVMAKSGMEIPIGDALPLMAVYGMRALLAGPYAEVGPLLAELMDCVQIVETAITRPLTVDDVEEVATRVRLRDEVFKLHTGFSLADALSVVSAVAAMETDEPTPDTAMPPPPSEPS